MSTRSWKLATVMGALAAALTMIPSAFAQCGLPAKAIKPSSWQPQFQGARVMPAQLVTDPIVGMWHVIFTASSMNNQPFSGVIDNAVVVWHNDGTEAMNSSRPAQDGNICLGIWAHTGLRKYFLNHIPWGGNDPANAPSGIGNPLAGTQIIEQITLGPGGNSYSGFFTLTAYNPDGSVNVSFTGTLAATRINVATRFSELM